MKNSVSVNIARFVALMIVQIYIFNNVNLFGYINPYPYVLFLLVFPFTSNRALYIFIAFLTGLTMDMFGNSGGVHAAACLFLAYLRPVALRFSFGVSYEYNAIKLSKVSFYERFIFISIMVLIHHLVLFLLEVFNISNILYTLNKTLVTSIFTIILCLTFNILFSSRNE
ncbi:rod shape-determining protein MreD [Dokdonia sp. Hel_I_63]|uniref:rod shape-determining protein MreD n=1 Tax=Dokdonia sp. Hel_I_63 TaxID=1249996 RepID=UPI0011990823|nr:rod shape-determining protein MreD [Dokdonia sp. Hel_I_63]TVZ24153.1 rod shape-determining protein MreD [Dokdonia sp. Hel_I_63]